MAEVVYGSGGCLCVSLRSCPKAPSPLVSQDFSVQLSLGLCDTRLPRRRRVISLGGFSSGPDSAYNSQHKSFWKVPYCENIPTRSPTAPAQMARADALKALGNNRLRLIVTAGALMGMLSSLLVYQYGQARIWFAMSRDRLLPRMFSKVHERFRTPHVSTWIAGLVVGIPAGIWDIDTFAELSNIGTLFAFVLVSLGVIVLRKTQPERPRSRSEERRV